MIKFLVLVLLLPILFSCEQSLNTLKSKETPEVDSIASWIAQSKQPKFNLAQKKVALEDAYITAQNIASDSIKNNFLAEIAIEAEVIDFDSLFIKVNKASLVLATKRDDFYKIGDSHWNYGNYYTDLEVVDSAYYHYHKAYENFKLVKHDYYAAKMLYNMAFIQGRLKDYTGSEVLIFGAISKFEKEKRPERLYECYNYLGLIYIEIEEFDRAIFYHNKALDYLTKIKDKKNYKEGSLSNIGLTYQKLNNYEKAIENFKKALNIRDLKNQDPIFYARLIDNIAYTKFLRGDTLNIAEDLYKSLKIRDSLNNISGVVICKRHLSEFYAVKKDTILAVKYANEAFELADQLDNNRDKLETLLLLSKVDRQKSNKYLNEYVRISDSLQVEDRKIRNKFTRIRFETDEYIEETEKLSQQNILILLGGFITILFISFAYFLRVQGAKNKELLFEKEQQKNNQEILSLMIKQQTKLEEGRLKERHRISEDLHDGVLGKIFGTRLGLGFLNINGDKETIEKHKYYVDELQIIEKEIRTISHELKNEILSSKDDFSKIIKDLIEKRSNLESFKYQYYCDEAIYWDNINDDIKINLYRILQEALQNIIKYADASYVEIKISLNNNNIELLVKDNGKGFNIKEKRKGIGLKNMQSRVEKIEGTLKIDSLKNEGTTIFVTCPIQTEKNEHKI
ncbi:MULTISPECIES: tetratricopeptide repeat-containing sensor histidine kinase [Flavobacteriaceae]|uniref:histidine kinase n=2 Tax=Flavobacteriaceae TaxID=49546 RepID=A0A4Y8ASM1_9FLAO|nr:MULTISPECIES: tetratricopeptide repeat-containing sensor histidine kinase [Flavobacteriaceae]TEW73819.1 tetratricopeptide repeat-containing sensor histidine kinase [Gramella jeungdoensis]GGK37868.1 two-component sensor histidine kinase [Lutibacter litoralis]